MSTGTATAQHNQQQTMTSTYEHSMTVLRPSLSNGKTSAVMSRMRERENAAKMTQGLKGAFPHSRQTAKSQKHQGVQLLSVGTQHCTRLQCTMSIHTQQMLPYTRKLQAHIQQPKAAQC